MTNTVTYTNVNLMQNFSFNSHMKFKYLRPKITSVISYKIYKNVIYDINNKEVAWAVVSMYD